MTDDPKEIQRRLELSTARQLPPDAELDRESAEWRATWLAYGRLLDASRAGVRRPASPRWARSRRRRRRWPMVAAAALAASVLLTLTGVWCLRGGAKPAPSPSSPAVAIKSPDTPRPSPATSVPQPVGDSSLAPDPIEKPPRAAALKIPAQWSDPIDQQIDRAAQAIVQMRDDSLVSASEAGRIRYQLEDMRKGIDAGLFQ